jgi:RNA polymerase sigma-70 factor (ECF subfamily)
MAQWDEVALIRRAREGDEAAREILYITYFAGNKQVRGLLSREVANAADREDVLHDAYLSLLRSHSEFRGDAKLQTFVYRVVQVAILQRLRAARAARESKMVRLTYEMEGDERHRELSVEDYQYEKVEAGAMAEKLYSFLPEPMRTAFRLRVTNELSYEEIAARTGAPVNTVATRIFKARALLSRLFGGPPGPREKKSAWGGN